MLSPLLGLTNYIKNDDLRQLFSFQYKHAVVWNKTHSAVFLFGFFSKYRAASNSLKCLELKMLGLKRLLHKSKKYKRPQPIRSSSAMLE